MTEQRHDRIISMNNTTTTITATPPANRDNAGAVVETVTVASQRKSSSGHRIRVSSKKLISIVICTKTGKLLSYKTSNCRAAPIKRTLHRRVLVHPKPRPALFQLDPVRETKAVIRPFSDSIMSGSSFIDSDSSNNSDSNSSYSDSDSSDSGNSNFSDSEASSSSSSSSDSDSSCDSNRYNKKLVHDSSSGDSKDSGAYNDSSSSSVFKCLRPACVGNIARPTVAVKRPRAIHNPYTGAKRQSAPTGKQILQCHEQISTSDESNDDDDDDAAAELM